MFLKEQKTKFYKKNQYLFAGITTNNTSLKTTFNIFNMNTELDLLVIYSLLMVSMKSGRR